MEASSEVISRRAKYIESHLEKLANACFPDPLWISVQSRPLNQTDKEEEMKFSVRIMLRGGRQDMRAGVAAFEEGLNQFFTSADYPIIYNISPEHGLNNESDVTFTLSGPVRRLAGDIFKNEAKRRIARTMEERNALISERQSRKTTDESLQR